METTNNTYYERRGIRYLARIFVLGSAICLGSIGIANLVENPYDLINRIRHSLKKEAPSSEEQFREELRRSIQKQIEGEHSNPAPILPLRENENFGEVRNTRFI